MDDLHGYAQAMEAAQNALSALYWLGVFSAACLAIGAALLLIRKYWP